MLALHLDCSAAALITVSKALSNLEMVKLKMLQFTDCMRTDISPLTSSADLLLRCLARNIISDLYDNRISEFNGTVIQLLQFKPKTDSAYHA